MFLIEVLGLLGKLDQFIIVIYEGKQISLKEAINTIGIVVTFEEGWRCWWRLERRDA
jgi:hypothetical protein